MAAITTLPTVVHQLIAMNFALAEDAMGERSPDLVALIELGRKISDAATFLPIAIVRS